MKLCITITISASGQNADLCIIVNGLSENELPMSEEELKQSRGIRVIEIAGLASGCSINPQNKETGFLILCCNVKGVDQARHDWYDEIFTIVSYITYVKKPRKCQNLPFQS